MLIAAAAGITLTPLCNQSEHFLSGQTMNDQSNLIGWILKATVGTLSIICFAVVAVMLVGLFDNSVDNKEIFQIIGPAFNTVIGAFVGLLGGLTLNHNTKNSKD